MAEAKQPKIPSAHLVRYHVLSLEGATLQMQRLGTTVASDLSRAGLFLAHTQLEPGLHVHFYFELPDGYLEGVGKVVHNQPRIDGVGVARPGSGLRFIRMSDGDRARLEGYLSGVPGGHRFSEGGVSRPEARG